MSIELQCRQEVVELHEFFNRWFIGNLPQDDAVLDRFAGVLASAFVIVTPDGHAYDRGAIVERVRNAHACGDHRIEIRNHRHRCMRCDVALVTYEEWQDTGDGRRGRLSSALFRAEPSCPNGVQWLHVHETWLPGD